MLIDVYLHFRKNTGTVPNSLRFQESPPGQISSSVCVCGTTHWTRRLPEITSGLTLCRVAAVHTPRIYKAHTSGGASGTVNSRRHEAPLLPLPRWCAPVFGRRLFADRLHRRLPARLRPGQRSGAYHFLQPVRVGRGHQTQHHRTEEGERWRVLGRRTHANHKNARSPPMYVHF